MKTYRHWCLAIIAALGTATIAYGLLVRTTDNDPSGDDYLEKPATVLHTRTVSAPSGEGRSEASKRPRDPALDLPTPPPKADIVGKSRFEQLPDELRNQLMNVYTEMGYGNFDQAAHTALDALELAHEYPDIRAELHYYQGLCYERLGYTDMAIEQYNEVLALQPLHRSSYAAMRLISPEFASANEELPPLKLASPKTAPVDQ